MVQVGQHNEVSLKWKTTAEFQNKSFIVQREAIPSGRFQDIATVTATNAAGGAEYSYIDHPGLSGKYLYRLAMVDLNGRKTYSESRLASLMGKSWRITDDGANWVLWSDQQIFYSLADLQGRIIEKGSFTGSKSINKPLSNSIYVLRVVSNGEVSAQKLMK